MAQVTHSQPNPLPRVTVGITPMYAALSFLEGGQEISKCQ